MKNVKRIYSVFLIAVLILLTIPVSVCASGEVSLDKTTITNYDRKRDVYISTFDEIVYSPSSDGTPFDLAGVSVNCVVKGFQLKSGQTFYRVNLANDDIDNAVEKLKNAGINTNRIIFDESYYDYDEYVYLLHEIEIKFTEAIDMPEVISFLDLIGVEAIGIEKVIDPIKKEYSDNEYTINLKSRESMLNAINKILAQSCIYDVQPTWIARTIYDVGDTNFDDSISAVDYAIIKRHILGTYTLGSHGYRNADIDGNGAVDVRDYLLLKKHILGTNKLDHLNIKRETN